MLKLGICLGSTLITPLIFGIPFPLRPRDFTRSGSRVFGDDWPFTTLFSTVTIYIIYTKKLLFRVLHTSKIKVVDLAFFGNKALLMRAAVFILARWLTVDEGAVEVAFKMCFLLG